MDRGCIKKILKEWILRVNDAETMPANIIALNFGLYEPYGVELIGSASYDADNSDWACEEDFEPAERNCPDLHIDKSEKWEDVLKAIRDILKELIPELNGINILSVSHITTGFCDGDLFVVK